MKCTLSFQDIDPDRQDGDIDDKEVSQIDRVCKLHSVSASKTKRNFLKFCESPFVER